MLHFKFFLLMGFLLIFTWGQPSLASSPYSKSSAPPYKCPSITREQMTQACWSKQKRSQVDGLSLYGVKCPGFGTGKKFSLKKGRGRGKLYAGTYSGERTAKGLSRVDPICAYTFHQLRTRRTAQIAVVDPSYRKGGAPSMEQKPIVMEGMEGLDKTLQPILPYDSSSGFLNTNQITPVALEATDRQFIEQTRGDPRRAIGTGKLLLLVRQQYVHNYNIQQLNQKDRDILGEKLLIKFFGGSTSPIIQSYQQTHKISIDNLEKLYETVKKDIFNKLNWTVTSESWNNKAKPLDAQFKEEIKLFFNTLFPDAQKASQIQATSQEKILELKKIEFLKRLFIALPWTKYAPTENASPEELKDWPFSLASLLGRGGRVLVVASDKNISPVFEFLMEGEAPLTSPSSPSSPKIYFKRTLASHGISTRKSDGYVIETKLKGLKGMPKNLGAGIQGRHLGINIPMGGLGSPQVDGMLVGMGGSSIHPTTGRTVEKRQHGHIYIHHKPTAGAFLVGIEPSAYGFHTMFGAKHTVQGGFGSSAEEISLTGASKWPLIQSYKGHPSPHGYGGKRLTITPDIFKKIKLYSETILKFSSEKQKEIFKKLLSLSGLEAQQFLAKSYSTVSIRGVPEVQELMDATSPHGLNLANVHERQTLVRQKGYGNDISTKIVLLQGQLSKEKALAANRQKHLNDYDRLYAEWENIQARQPEGYMQQMNQRVEDMHKAVNDIKRIDAQLEGFLIIRKDLMTELKETLGLTESQIKAIPDLDTYKHAFSS